MATPTKPSNKIVVPRADAGSFNPHRPLAKNLLLLHQVEHFQAMEKKLPPEQQTGVDPKTIKTEGDASEYIRKMTARLHPQVKESGPQVMKSGGA